jgi:integrase
MTVAEYLAYWLDSYAQHNTRTSTYTSYAMNVRAHITPSLGHIALQKLTPSQLQAFYSGRLKGGRADGKSGGLSGRTVRLLHSILREALHHAVKQQLVMRNVADATDPPKGKRPPVKVWDQEQVLRFLAVAETDYYNPLWLVNALTGLRRGELLGLRWEDVDLDRSVLQVRQALVEVAGKRQFEEPKTASGKRQVELGASCVAALRAHRSRQVEQRLLLGPAWQDTGLVFTTAGGKALMPTNLDRRFKQLLRQAALPDIPLHALRHTHATLLLKNGEHPKIVQERLGHANIGITLDTYSQVLPGMQRKAADGLDEALFGS